jgi:hypothetical protein
MTSDEHREAAESYLQQAEAERNPDGSFENIAMLTGYAQAHATLALVMQNVEKG